MKKIEAIIRPERLQDVQDALDGLGVSGLTVTEVVGCGRQKGYTEQYRGSRANISLLPKIKVESVVPPDMVDAAVEAIVGAARTGEIGDGRVFVYPVEQAVRIRTGESGEETVRPRRGGGLGPLGRALDPLEPGLRAVHRLQRDQDAGARASPRPARSGRRRRPARPRPRRR